MCVLFSEFLGVKAHSERVENDGVLAPSDSENIVIRNRKSEMAFTQVQSGCSLHERIRSHDGETTLNTFLNLG